MAQPYVGEIRMFGGNFAPAGWQFCNGSLLAISEYEVLFQLIGTTYGGDGESTFAVPDLCGRIPVHMGQSAGTSNYQLGEKSGVEGVTLTINQIPIHSHVVSGELTMKVRGGDPDNQVSPVNNGLAIAAGKKYFSRAPTVNTMAPLTTDIQLSGAGGSQPHDNMQPFLAVSFIISLFGIFPTQS